MKTYAFDHVFNSTNSQEEVYQQCAAPIVESVLKGYNGTLFAYGQTGTGKTFTMEGNITDPKHQGITPRTFTQIMDFVSNAPEDIEFLVRISFLEIYQDEVHDLLSRNVECWISDYILDSVSCSLIIEIHIKFERLYLTLFYVD